jgi:hypothetical protein
VNAKSDGQCCTSDITSFVEIDIKGMLVTNSSNSYDSNCITDIEN